MNVVSLFSGCGGMDLGFKNAGYNVIWANDILKEAYETYKHNIGNHIVLDSIDEISTDIVPQADILIGGPPCQSFSLAGKRETEDDRGQLVWEYLRILEAVEPKCFLFENVVGLKSATTQNGEKVLDNLKSAFAEKGYTIFVDTINIADYGIPQRRKRVFIVGFKEQINFEFPKPTHSENGENGLKTWLSVEEAIGDLPEPSIEEYIQYRTEYQNNFQEYMRNKSEVVTEHKPQKLSELDMKIIESVPAGGNYMHVPDSIAPRRILKFKETGGRTTCYGRLLPNKPSYTINTYFDRPNSGCNIHYDQNRTLTIREAMRLQTFPDTFQLLANSKRKKHIIIGNAVPPMMAEILARHIYKHLV